MHNLSWTQILLPQPIQKPDTRCSMNGTANNQLIFHGIIDIQTDKTPVTWILDLSSLSWRKHTVTVDHYRFEHTGTTGLNNSVLIVGGNITSHQQNTHNSTFVIRLEPKSLQQLAMRIVYDHRAVLPWKLLPKMLTCKMMGTQPEEPIDPWFTLVAVWLHWWFECTTISKQFLCMIIFMNCNVLHIELSISASQGCNWYD